VAQIRVINMSLGGSANDPVIQSAVEYALAHGKVIVAAAGNDGSTPEGYPAGYPGVLAVASVGPTGARAAYSNYGVAVRNGVAAPGGARSATPDDPTWTSFRRIRVGRPTTSGITPWPAHRWLTRSLRVSPG